MKSLLIQPELAFISIVALGVSTLLIIWAAAKAYRQPQAGALVTGKEAVVYDWRYFVKTSAIWCTTAVVLTVSMNTVKKSHRPASKPVQPIDSRMSIVDRDGGQLAETISAFDLWFVPHEFWAASPANPRSDMDASTEGISDEMRRALLLNTLSDWPQIQSVVSDRLNNRNKSDTNQKILAWAIDPIIAEKVAALNLAGLRLSERPARQYPKGRLFPHAIGFMGLSDIRSGQEGMELVANHRLRTLQIRGERFGSPLQTTLAPEIQTLVRNALQKGVAAYGATGAAAIVVEVQSGTIAAMVSWPDFDPDDASTFRNPYQPERILNRAVAINFPVGSLLTPLLVAHGIETGRFQPKTVLSMGNGALKIGKTIIRDSFPEQTMSIAEIVVKSSNIGQAKVALQLPVSELKGVAKSLGIGEALGISGLIGGVNHEDIAWDEWTSGMLAEPGMHIQTNLMQAVKAYLPIANGGELMPLSLLAKNLNLSAVPRVLSPQTALGVREILESAASPIGTAPRARVTGIRVAGKSTTISDVRQGSSRYLGEKLPGNTISAFIGMAPTEKPQFLVGVMFQFPQGKVRFGGESAAPVFSEIIGQILDTSKGSTAANQTIPTRIHQLQGLTTQF